MKFNIGTYSFGMQSSLTLQEKFKKAAEMGYSGIEILTNDLNNYAAEDIKKWADEAGVEIVSIHAGFDGHEDEHLEKFASLGGKTYIIPNYKFANKEEAYELADKLNELAQKAAVYGLKVGYHNHTTEFFEDEGKPILAHVMDKASDNVYFQIDCGWATAAGVNCPDFIRAHAGKIFAIHVKECNGILGTGTPQSNKTGAQQNMPKMQLDENGKPVLSPEIKAMMAAMRERTKVQVPLGDETSLINWHEIRKALDEQGLPEVFWTVERENDYANDILKCLADDAAWLNANIK